MAARSLWGVVGRGRRPRPRPRPRPKRRRRSWALRPIAPPAWEPGSRCRNRRALLDGYTLVLRPCELVLVS
uniref:Uncharacterized protein n=1 Tax=Mustela putorius furo TaxID=9669 RepID=M3YXR7_MUSPF